MTPDFLLSVAAGFLTAYLFSIAAISLYIIPWRAVRFRIVFWWRELDRTTREFIRWLGRTLWLAALLIAWRAWL